MYEKPLATDQPARERDAVRAEDADRRRAAHRQRLNRGDDLVDR